MILLRMLSLAVFLIVLSAAPVASAADEPQAAEPITLIATLFPSSTWLVLAQLPLEGEPAMEIVPSAAPQVLVGRITSDGTKVIGCVENEVALRNLLNAPPDELRKKSRSEVQ